MLTEKYLEVIYNKLINDEAFCRLIYYFDEPMDMNKSDVKSLSNFEDVMKNIIRFSPQTYDLGKSEIIRINMYKQYNKLNLSYKSIINEQIQFDIYIPNRLIQYDMRPYQIESKIIDLLDNMQLGIGYLDYTNGTFQKMPNIAGYSEYDMSFSLKEGRKNLSARY